VEKNGACGDSVENESVNQVYSIYVTDCTVGQDSADWVSALWRSSSSSLFLSLSLCLWKFGTLTISLRCWFKNIKICVFVYCVSV
jgi:hypothetical protein